MIPKCTKTYYPTGELEYEFYHDPNNERYWHREGGPAYVRYYRNGSIAIERYYVNDKRHRVDGPARISYYRGGNVECEEYWINGNELSKEEVEEFKRQKEFDEYFKDMLNEVG